MEQKYYHTSIVKNRLFCLKYVLYRQKNSHYGTSLMRFTIYNILKIKSSILKFCLGILYARVSTPSIKRKIEMENFEGNMNYSLLHMYLYVSYLDTLNELNNIKLTDHKDSCLKKLGSNPGYSDILCLNLIMNYKDLINS